MTDKELIKQEIERLKHTSNAYDRSRFMLLLEIEKFIDSLPEENHFEDNSEMVSDDLEEAADSFYDNCNMSKSSWWDEGVLHKMSESKETFIAGAAWQKQKDQETIELAEDHAMLAGMNRMKEEMMKDAVEAEVFIDYNINFGYGSLTANIDLDEQHLKEGDKVKIIIVKED